MTRAVLVAAAASGQGKTTVAAALARLHARAGARVRAFKCGPDFLDPQWLALASGAPVHALDLWINGEADCAHRLAQAARQADLIVIEGVMGLYDGEPSAADLAERFSVPVLGVIDARAMAGTFAAVAHGLQQWRPALAWAGVMANQVAGVRHAAMLQNALRENQRWLGAMPRSEAFALPSRHLGLAAASELPDAIERLDRAADALATTPIGQHRLADWPRWRPPVPPDAPTVKPLLAGRRVAIAHDAAFAFIYSANVDTLRALGAEPVFFAPLQGDSLPACDAVWLPGGYPELHAAALAARTDLRGQLAAHVAAGKPLWAECGGMMALADELIDGEGRRHAMWGLLPGRAVLGQRLATLGPHAWRQGGDELRGHSFHWSRFETDLPASAHALPARGDGPGEPVYRVGALRASWFHPWFASSPDFTAALFLPEARS
jgi:cobyrinic acid a,c-diamide synthase